MNEEGHKARLEAAKRYTTHQIKLGNACKSCGCDYSGTCEKLDFRGICWTCKVTKRGRDADYQLFTPKPELLDGLNAD